MKKTTRRFALKAIAASATAMSPWSLQAQGAWPNKPIKIIVPVAAGGIIDLVARNLAEALQPKMGVPFVIDSRPGADHAIGTQLVARSEPDGYSWLCGSVPFTTTSHLRTVPPFDPFKDFKPVSLLATSPNVLVVPTTLGVDTMAEFIALGKRKNGGLTYANPGTGSSNHLGTEQLRSSTGIEMLGIPYKGQPPAIVDLLTGRVDFMLMSSSLAPAHIESGKLKALGSVSTARLPKLPNVPTMKELGFDSVNVIPWFGILVPAGTPDAIVERVHLDIRGVASTAGYRDGLSRFGATPAVDHSISDFAASLRTEFNQWPSLLRQAGLSKT
jgi:tripartite-type tricarboxylate transporter receptor subunit TctC